MPEVKNATEQVNKTFIVTSNPVEVVIKKPNAFKFSSNLTVLGMRGSDRNELGVDDKVRDKRSPGDYDYPNSKEIPRVSSDVYSGQTKAVPRIFSDELSARSMDSGSLMDSDSFEMEFRAARRSLGKRKSSPFSASFEDFDIGFGLEESGSEDEDYSDEKDAYDIHGYRGAAEDRSAGIKPPAYGLAAHDFTPVRVGPSTPVNFPQRKLQTVTGFRTATVHRYPGFALPGTSTESSLSQQVNSHEANRLNVNSHEATKPQTRPNKMNENDGMRESEKNMNMGNMQVDDSDEHHHHHFYDQLRHVHINPPKGFDPDSFRLTLPHFVKKGKFIGKKHKHFHHIENAPVIIKYETPTTVKPKPATARPLTESEEEAMYDEEGELSEKEIENAYKNYDDTGVTKGTGAQDYQIQSEEEEEEEEEEESGEETKLKEITALSSPLTIEQAQKDKTVKVDKAFKNISKTLKNNVTNKPNSFTNFWKVEYSLK